MTHPNVGLTVFAIASLMETLKAPLMEAPKAILTVRLLAFHLAFSTVHLTAIQMERLKALPMAPSKADLTAIAMAPRKAEEGCSTVDLFPHVLLYKTVYCSPLPHYERIRCRLIANFHLFECPCFLILVVKMRNNGHLP